MDLGKKKKKKDLNAVGQGRILTASGGGPAAGAVIEYSGTPGIFEIPVLDPLGRHVSNEPFRESQEMLLGSCLLYTSPSPRD